MPRKLYIPLFIVFAVAFVPVILYSGIVEFVVPASWIAAFTAGTLLEGKFGQAAWAAGHFAGYLILFYAVAHATHWVARRAKTPAGRLTIQTTVLLGVFLCSFLRTITYTALQGRGGTYTLWGAVSRCFEKYRAR